MSAERVVFRWFIAAPHDKAIALLRCQSKKKMTISKITRRILDRPAEFLSKESRQPLIRDFISILPVTPDCHPLTCL